jgi:mercuric ion binding protein
MKKLFFVMMLAAMSTAANAKSVNDTLVVTTTPQMHCANCENKIKNGLRFEKGVKDIFTSVENPDKTDKQKLEGTFPKFGYKARELKKGVKVERDMNEQCDNM